jgi:hypothetical protein
VAKPHVFSEARTPPWHSKLVPFEADIWRWRRHGDSYRTIATALKEKHGLDVSFVTVGTFINARKKRYTRIALPPRLEELPEVVPSRPTAAVPVAQPHPAKVSTNSAKTVQTGSRGFPLPDSQEIVAKDRMGLPISRNKPFKGEV